MESQAREIPGTKILKEWQTGFADGDGKVGGEEGEEDEENKDQREKKKKWEH